MSMTDHSSAEHRETWEILPWFVNGRLDALDREKADAHLRACDACRRELAEQRRLCQAMIADSKVEHMPIAALKRFQQRLATHESTAQPATVEVTPRRSPAHPIHRRGLMAASVTVMAVALGFGASALWNPAQRRAITADYYTVTTAPPYAGKEVIRAVFAPTVTLSDLQSLLDDAHLRIVAGPTEAGVYSLAMTTPQPATWSLQRLRAHATVRFAEAVGPEADREEPR